ncbi:hypothetical protein FWK73_04705 [Listeria monocytogenes]|nr:hypothetical protein [Listeria monocytogenes]
MSQQSIQGTIIGVDEFFKDFEAVASSDAAINQDQVLTEIIERCIENQNAVFGLILEEERTKAKKAMCFDFACAGEETREELTIFYLDCHEAS